MQRRIGRGALYLALGIFLLFLLRLGYGYLSPGTRGSADASDGPGMSTTRNNYASEKMVVKRSMQESYDVSQKYEKIASIRSRTSRFEQDEKRLRAMTTRYEALIQFERSTGLPGRRALQVAIGVPPEKFDAMVAELRSIGEIASIRIDKSDRTNEFKELNARRVSLEKARDALGALKERGGGIDESINLEDKILQIEEQLQDLGVKLGAYDQENEFCTVKYVLAERGSAVADIPLSHRIRVAAAWTARYSALGLGIAGAGLLFLLLMTLLLEKLRWIPTAAGRTSDTAGE